MKDYYAVVFLPEPVGSVVDRLRTRYDPRSAEVIGAHLTLAGPFAGATGLEALSRMLPALHRMAAFDVVLGGVKTFLPVTPVVYFEVGPREPLYRLHQVFHDTRLWGPPRHPFVPHVTIAEHEGEAEARRVMDELAGQRLDHKFRVDRVSIVEVPILDGRYARGAAVQEGALGPA